MVDYKQAFSMPKLNNPHQNNFNKAKKVYFNFSPVGGDINCLVGVPTNHM